MQSWLLPNHVRYIKKCSILYLIKLVQPNVKSYRDDSIACSLTINELEYSFSSEELISL